MQSGSLLCRRVYRFASFIYYNGKFVELSSSNQIFFGFAVTDSFILAMRGYMGYTDTDRKDEKSITAGESALDKLLVNQVAKVPCKKVLEKEKALLYNR